MSASVISVVIPTYNDAHFLPTALESCLAQTIPVQIVLVDDGSTTPMPESVVRFIADHRDVVTLIRHAWNCGLSAARNTGIAHARFDFVIPLDADDWFLPGSLAPLTAALSEDVDIVYGNVVDSGKLYEPVKRPLQREDFLEDTPLFCGSLFRKTVWQAVGGYTVRLGAHYEDWNFWAKAFKAGFRFHYVPVTVYEHRSRPDSMLRHLHNDRAKYVRVATEPLRDPDPVPAACTADAVIARAGELAGPSILNAQVEAVLRVLSGQSAGEIAGAGRDADDVVQAARRFLERGARGLADDERRSPEMLSSHARIGKLMIELQRARDAAAAVEARTKALIDAHATMGRLLSQQNPAATSSPSNGGPASAGMGNRSSR